jgi:TetR/AcrR family transcriptional regulator
MTASSDDTRAELLARSLDLFAAYGYDGVGVQQICASAGVTKPTLYHHFGSKRGVLEALIDERIGPLRIALSEKVPRGELAATLMAVAEATFAFAAKERSFYRLYLTLWFAPIRSEAYEVARLFHERHFAAVERLFRNALAAEGLSEGRSRALAAAFLGVLNNAVGLALNNYAALSANAAREAAHAFLYGFATQPGGASQKLREKRLNIPTGK